MLFLPPSDAYVRSFLYLLYTLIKLYYTSSERSSLVSGPRLNSSPAKTKNPSVFACSTTTFRYLSLYKIAVKRREVKSKGEKERYFHLNAESQRITRREKKSFLSDQCKEIEENNRMGKTRDLFRKIEIPREHFMQR